MKATMIIVLFALVGCAASGPKWYRDEAGNASSRVKPVGKDSPEIHDPLEDVPQFADAFKIASAEAERFVSENGRRVMPAYRYYQEKKRILRERFHIDWKTPMELNPETVFD